MVEIKVPLIKELRDRTGAGVVDCKKALIEANGEIELAIRNMRKLGVVKASRREGNITTNGVVLTKIDGNHGIILEVNCETDFVAKNTDFLTFVNTILNTAISKKEIDIKVLRNQFESNRVELITKVGENIYIRRLGILDGDILGSYQHFFRIGVLVSVKENFDKKVIKQLAMHIASNKPNFIKPEDISREIVEEEYQIQLNIAMQSGKPQEIAKKIANGRVKKFFEKESLVTQPFVIDPSKTVSQFLKEQSTEVIGFIRFEVGEKSEKQYNLRKEIPLIPEDF